MIRADQLTVPSTAIAPLRETLEVLWGVAADALAHAALEHSAWAADEVRRLEALRRLLRLTSGLPPAAPRVELDAPPELLREAIVGTVHELVSQLTAHVGNVDPSSAEIGAAMRTFELLEEHLLLLVFHDAVTPPELV